MKMEEQMNQQNESNECLEIQIKLHDTILITRGRHWSEVIAKSAIGNIKYRVSTIANHDFVFNSESNRWVIILRESLGQIKTRIALALLFVFPERISRTDLVLMSDIHPDRIREYLTNPSKGITENIDENDLGIILSDNGFKWAIEILKTEEANRSKNGSNHDEQPTNSSE